MTLSYVIYWIIIPFVIGVVITKIIFLLLARRKKRKDKEAFDLIFRRSMECFEKNKQAYIDYILEDHVPWQRLRDAGIIFEHKRDDVTDNDTA